MIKPTLIDIQCFLNRFRYAQIEFALHDKYLFLHIPKTAGTTFRFILYNHIQPADVFPSRSTLHAQGSGYLSSSRLVDRYDFHEMQKQHHLICGHFSYQQAQHIRQEFPKIITFLREPVARTISHMRHIRKESGEDLEAIWAHSHRIFSNFQAKHFGYTQEKDNIQETLKVMDTCHFVGLSEHFQESLDQLNKATGWQLKNTKPKNINSNRDADISPELRDTITEHMSADIALYKHVLKGYEA